jgi:hypothetical protein
MSTDDKPPMPPQPKTLEIPAVQVPANTLDAVLTEMRAMRIESRDANQELRADIQLISSDLQIVKGRVSLVESRLNEQDDRGAKHSGGLTRESRVNEEQSAAIASVIVKQDETAVKVDALSADVTALTVKVDAIANKPDTAALVLGEVRELAKTPTAKKILSAALPVILLAISAIGIKLQMSVTKLEAKPDTVQVQAAPTVYVPVQMPATLDGGAK